MIPSLDPVWARSISYAYSVLICRTLASKHPQIRLARELFEEPAEDIGDLQAERDRAVEWATREECAAELAAALERHGPWNCAQDLVTKWRARR